MAALFSTFYNFLPLVFGNRESWGGERTQAVVQDGGVHKELRKKKGAPRGGACVIWYSGRWAYRVTIRCEQKIKNS